MKDQLALFVCEFAKNPLRTGAVAPSSPKIARGVVVPVPERGEPVVVELGPGTGAFTAEIQRRLRGRGHHLAVEINDKFAALLRRRFPALDIAVSDAVHIPQLLDERGLASADVIVSGLPWAVFSPQVQYDLLDAVCDCLSPDGAFTAFAYIHAAWFPPARRFRGLLRATFEEVIIGRTVWGNIPPATVYTARRFRPPHERFTKELTIAGTYQPVSGEHAAPRSRFRAGFRRAQVGRRNRLPE